MRAFTPALKAYLDDVRAVGGGRAMAFADCYTFALTNGLVLRYCDKDVPVSLAGNTFLANSVRVSGARYKCATGLDVDSQELDIIAAPTDMAGPIPFLQALRLGVFDACAVSRDRAFFAASAAGAYATLTGPPIGSVNLFTGRLATIDALGRTSARITVVSLLMLLDIDMPRNFYQPNCNHALYDAGCGLTKSAFAAAGTVGAGSTNTSILWGGAAATYAQGTLTMTSGALAGVSAGIKTVANGALQLVLPLRAVPAAGDTFLAYPGCDHTRGSQGCAKFNNLGRFRGFPFIPPATSTYSSGN